MRLFYLLVTLALLVSALLFTWEGGFQEPAPVPAAAAPEPPRYALTGVEWLRLGREGEPEFRVEAETLDYYADESVTMQKVRVDALGGYGTPWRIEAPRGQAPAHERRLKLTGGVHATGALTHERANLVTARLWVDLLRHELYTDADVRFQSEFRNATARGLRSDFAGEHVQLLNDVRVDYVPES